MTITDQFPIETRAAAALDRLVREARKHAATRPRLLSLRETVITIPHELMIIQIIGSDYRRTVPVSDGDHARFVEALGAVHELIREAVG